MAKAPLAEFRSERRRTKRRREIQHYVTKDEPEWTGPVVRLEQLTDEELRALGGYARDERPRSVHLTWRCTNPFCGNWTMNGAWRTGRCNFCQTTRGDR